MTGGIDESINGWQAKAGVEGDCDGGHQRTVTPTSSSSTPPLPIFLAAPIPAPCQRTQRIHESVSVLHVVSTQQ